MKNRLKSAVALALLSGGCVLASAALAGPSSVTALMGADAAGISRAALTMATNEKPTPAAPTSTAAPLIAPYCIRDYSFVEPITLVAVDGINNATPATSSTASEDFTATIGAMAPGGSYPISVKGNTDGNYSSGIAVYIDWNQNDDFDDAGEGYFLGTLVGSTGVDALSVNGVIAVPGAATLGPTRMRVVKQYNGTSLANTAACGTGGFGQAEDYTVNIDVNAPVPPALDMAFAPTNGPVGDSSTLTITLGNTAASANALNTDFTNTFPAGLEVAAIPAASTTCTSGTVTTGTNSITLGSGASIPPGGCTVEVDVTAAVAGIYVNAIAAGALDTASGGGPSASATYQATQNGVVTYNAGFEAPAYTTGNLNGKQGWYASVANDWKVSTTNPGEGAQAVRGTWTAAGSGTSFILSPTQPAGTTDYSVASAKLAITVAGGGATWDFAPQDPATGSVITRVRFLKGAGNKIQVLADVGGTTSYIDTGASWVGGGAYFDLKLITDRSDGTYKLCIDNTEVYAGAGFSNNIGNIAIIGTKGTGTQNNVLDVDNVVINNTNWGTCALPTYTVTPSIGAGDGTTTPTGPQTVSENDTIAFTLIPDSGFEVDTVGGTCGGSLAGDVFTTAAIMGDCDVIASFRAANVIVAKAFDPAVIEESVEQSTLTITLTNEKMADATLTAPLVDTLPADLDIVPGTGSTTCGLVIGGAEVTPSAAGTITLPAGIVIPSRSSCQISVKVKSDVPGTYVNTILAGDLQTNQGSNPDDASATLTVTGHPEIAVTPASLATTVAMNASSTANLNIENIGSEDLTYSIAESVARNSNPPSFRNAPVTLGSMASLARAPSAGVSGDAYVLADFDISQMADNSPGDQGVSCGTSGTSTAPNSWWRRFYFNEHPQVGAAANIKSVTVSSGSNAIAGGLPITINLYTLAHSTAVDTIPTANLTLIGTANGVINDGLASITIPVTGVVSDTVGMDLVVEYFTPGNDAGGQFFPGANATPETHPTFISSADCGINAPTKASAIDFPDFHLTMVVTLEEAASQACVNVTDIPWLSASPTSGTVIPGAQDTVVVTFNASGMPAGTHSANLCVNSNDDQGNELVVVPVEMTVTPSGNTFEVTSTVNGGNGTISPASVTVDENASATFTLTPDFGFAAGPVTSSCGGTLTGDTFVTGPVSAACTVEATFVALPFPAPYCNVTFPSAVEPITRVIFTGIDNGSSATVGGSPALENFLSVTGGEVSLGGRYPIAVEGNTDGGFTAKIRVFVDWNRDGVFDASEAYVLTDLVGSTGADGKQSTGEIVVPAGAVLGETRMRVIKRFNTAPEPCNTASYGQAEDYTITINNDPLPVPEIDIDSGAFDGTGALVIPSAMVGTSASTTLDVMNIGEANSRLEYLIKRAMAERPAAGRRAVANERLSALANDALKATAAGLAQDPVNHTDLVASAALSGTTLPTVGNVVFANDPLCAVGTPGLVVHDGNGLPENGYGWNPAAGTDPKIVDKFTPSTYPAKYTTVCVSLLTNAGVTSAPVKVVVFADDGAGGAPGTELGRVSAVANNIGVGLVQSFQAIDISSMNLNIGSGSVYIGLEWDATGVSGLFIGADESSATNAGGYSYSSAAWTPTVDGHPAYKAMFIRAIEEGAGPPGVGCANPSSIPWLSATPTSGTVMEGDTDTVTVTGNAAGMAPGNYEALLCIESNDPNTSRIDITVKFEVTPLPPAIFSDGFEGEDPPPSPDIVTGEINLPLANDEDGGAFNFLTGSLHPYGPTDHINLYNFGDGMYAYWYGDVWSLDVGGVTDSGGVEFAVLQPGDTIGPASNISASSIPMANWIGGADGYIGVAFENTDTGQLNYGYIHMTTSGPDGYPAQMLEYGYNKAGAAITIPNP